MKREQDFADANNKSELFDLGMCLITRIFDSDLNDYDPPSNAEEKEENTKKEDEGSNYWINADQISEVRDKNNKNNNTAILVKRNKSGVKEFKCNVEGCNKKYKSKENLTLHVKNIHDKVKPYTCEFCLSSFSHRNGKRYHERKSHMNYLPNQCTHENCTARFACKSALTAHVKSFHLKLKRKKKKDEQFL